MKINLLRIILTISLFFIGQQCWAKILSFDDFQQSDISKWLSPKGDKNKIRIWDYQGNKTFRLQASSYAVKIISTLGYRNVRFSTTFYGYSLEDKEKCTFQVSIDGGKQWRDVGALISGKDDGFTPVFANIYWPEADDKKQVLLRVSINGNQSNDICYFDDVKVTGEKVYPEYGNKYGKRQFSYQFIDSNKKLATPVNNRFYAPPQAAAGASNQFEGVLEYQGNTSHELELIDDIFGFRKEKTKLQYDRLPPFSLQLVQSGNDLIPIQRGPQLANHEHWEIMLEPGRVWDDVNDKGYSRAALPFALQEKGANCVHNGLLTFLYKTDGSMSRVLFQIGSETCAYFKFDMWGSFKGSYKPQAITARQQSISAYEAEKNNRLPTKPITELTKQYPDIDTTMFGANSEVHPSNMSLYGTVIDGVNYVSDCHTRFGPYPYCDVMDLPSYSTAKSINALVFFQLLKQYPELRQRTIAELVSACSGKSQWRDVTVEHALNMTTGNYVSDGYEVDEYVSMVPFFDADTYSGKTSAACRFPRKAEPGSKWVYHTSDTYLYGTALNSFWREKNNNNNADYYDDLLVPVWQKLGLSPLMQFTRRTYDTHRQPYAGYGITYHRGDIAKLATAIAVDNEQLNPLTTELDINELSTALQRNNNDRGVDVSGNTKYKHAFWAWNAAEVLGCARSVWIPFMSGYGGISVVMMPNDIVYYYFSDNHDYRWRNAVIAANNIKPLC